MKKTPRASSRKSKKPWIKTGVELDFKPKAQRDIPTRYWDPILKRGQKTGMARPGSIRFTIRRSQKSLQRQSYWRWGSILLACVAILMLVLKNRFLQ